MNAKRMRTIRQATGVSWTAVGLVMTASALLAVLLLVPTLGLAQTADPVRLSRSDVDKILKQAREAIAEGNLDQAEALVQRAEGAQIRYQLFHIGLTPAQVRFQLTRAQRAAKANPQRVQSHSPQNQPTSQEPSNPFQRAVNPLTQSTGAAPAARTQADPSNDLAAGLSLQNPFRSDEASAGGQRMSPAADSPVSGALQQPLGLVRTRTDAVLSSGDSMDGPAPYVTESGASPSTDAKAQVLDLLAGARQALDAGDFEQADALVHEAGAMGVPESHFLPTEDRPSYVAWDIQQAHARQTGVFPADRIPTDGGPHGQYAQPAQFAEQSASGAGRPVMTLVPPTSGFDELSRAANSAEPQTELRISQSTDPTVLPSSRRSPGANEPLPIDNNESPFADDPLPYENESMPFVESLPAPSAGGEAFELLQQGEVALEQSDQETAVELFEEAYERRDQLDVESRERLQEHLQMLPRDRGNGGTAKSSSPSLLDAAASGEQVLARQLSAEVGKRQSEARRLRSEDPKKAIEILKQTQKEVTESNLSEEYRATLLRRIDFTLGETERYLEDHAAEIELNEKNQAVREEVERSRELKLRLQEKIAELVDQFNKLRDEQRYGEMEVVARRLYELAPNDPVAQQVWQNSKFIRRTIMNRDLADRKEESFWAVMNDVENAAVQDVGDGREMRYDQKHWDLLVKNRKGSDERNGRRTERELEIERRMKTPVLLRYDNAPLSEVVNGLGELAGVNIHLDPRGLSQEGINSDTPVTVNLSKEISLKSALNLILEPLHLSYVIKDEVLKVTSEQLRDGEIYSKVYNVADLVVPIPNFVPSNNIGLQGLINDAHAVMGYGNGVGMPGPAVLLGSRGQESYPAGAGNDQLVAQRLGGMPGTSGSRSSLPLNSGPGGLGGGANADFDSLIDLIVSTVATETWAENGGGEAEIREFPTNLSLVISQTQAVHEQIADLLEQLRRLQDLQVTIEVRFIRLSDNFFERIGFDFDMNIDNPGPRGVENPAGSGQFTESVTVGMELVQNPTQFPTFTADLDIPFRQGGFDITRPIFGGVGTPTDFGRFGFAILSDIEAFFIIEAAQGDRRTNMLQAPKVTLFNGQQAIVTDVVQMPFVIGVIPVVGEFAAAQQPVIVVLNEGTLMSIQAVVSDDRRYVRLTVVPFFTDIGDVQTFTFEGTTSSTSSKSSAISEEGEDNISEEESESDEVIHSGVTVQLPEFSVITVATTVSVPDGGTVLLGGIKRLNEGRNEYGVPLLSKVPYVNRLFRNVGIGREANSLMMMVTPRIIIQEEEEERLGIAAGGP